MTKDFKDVVSDVLNSTDEFKIVLAKNALKDFAKACEPAKYIKDDDIPKIINIFTRVFVSSDKQCSKREKILYEEATGQKMTYDEFYALTNHGSREEYIQACVKLVETLPRKAREALIAYGIALSCCDDEVTSSELELIDRFLDE